MIGRYLQTLTPEQEARVLTETFEPLDLCVRRLLGLPSMEVVGSCRCLVMTAEDTRSWVDVSANGDEPGMRYEGLCVRVGVVRANALIRTRVLRNQARRALAGQREVLSCR